MRGVILQTDEQALQGHLDAQPGDVVTRLVLADLLEEQGRDDEAKAQRLLVEMKLWPCNDLSAFSDFSGDTGWHWWSHSDDQHRHALIPERLQRHMPGAEWIYDTRLEAEADFLQALRDAGEL